MIYGKSLSRTRSDNLPNGPSKLHSVITICLKAVSQTETASRVVKSHRSRSARSKEIPGEAELCSNLIYTPKIQDA